MYSNPKYEPMMKELGLSPSISPSKTPLGNEVKVWRMNSLNEDKIPICALSFQLFPSSSMEIVTSMAVNEENEIIALGCQSGYIYYMKVISFSFVYSRATFSVASIRSLLF